MEETKKNSANPLATESVMRLMVRFSVPSILGMLVSSLYNIVDQLFIGNAVGIDGNSATNVAFPFTTVCTALALLFGIGGASCFNLTMGRGDKKQAGYFAGNSFVLLAVSGIILSAVTLIFLNPLLKVFGSREEHIMQYAQEYVKITALGFPFLIFTTGGGHLIRADGSPQMAMTCNIIGAVVNTVLDALFVMRFDWGMKGAAAATVIGQVVSAIIVLVYAMHYKTVHLGKKEITVKFFTARRIASIGMASFFNQIAIAIVQIVLNNSLGYYGKLSVYGESEPIAVCGIVMKVAMILFGFVIGLAQGTQPIESFNYGAKNYDRVRQAYKLAVTAGAGISVIAFALFFMFPRQILSLFGDGTDTYYELGEKFFRIYLFFTWLNCLQPITATFFTSIGKPIKGVFLSLTRQIIFFVPLLLIFPKFFQIEIYGIIYSAPVADFMAAIVTIIMASIEFKNIRKLEAEGK